MKVSTLLIHRIAPALATTIATALAASVATGGTPPGDRSTVSASEWSLAVPVAEVNSPAAEGCPIESPDGLSLFFASTRVKGIGNDDIGLGGNDIWVADRDTLTSPWKAPRNLGAPVNSSSADFCPTPVLGRSLLFVSERPADGTGPAPCGGGDIYLSRQSPAGGWSTPTMLKCAPEGPNFPGAERSPSLVKTWFGTFLFYSSNGDGGDQDIYVSRMGSDGSFGPGKVVKDLSTEYEDIMPNVREREDGSFEIVFSSNRPTPGQTAPLNQDVYISRSWWPTGGWTAPQNLGSAINTTAGNEQRATLSRDGKRLYFGRNGDIYMSTRQKVRPNH